MRTTPTVKQLRAFEAVYRTGKVATAAAELALTQSAVSMLLKQLESKLGSSLFDRTTRALHPTDAAHVLADAAGRLLKELDGLAADLRQQGGRTTKVRLAVTPAVAQALMPRALRRLAEENPEVRVVMDDCAPDQFVASIVAERVDFGVGILDQEHPELASEVLLRDQLHLVLPPAHPLAGERKVLRWAGLAGCPLILVKPGYGIRMRIDAAAAQAGVALDVVHEVSLYATALAMVKEGLGAAVLPGSLLREGAEGLVARRLVAPGVARSVSLVTKRGHSLSPAARKLLACLQQAAR